MKLSAPFPLLLFLLFFSACCKKDRIDLPGSNNIPGLPPATQNGANTLGFLLNGEPWVPNGVNSLTIDYDPGFNQGIIGISASKFVSLSNRSSFGIGISDSLNFLSAPFTRLLTRTGIYRAGFSFIVRCDISSHYDAIWSLGYLNITKLDRTTRIIAGTFAATMYGNSGCDTIKITNGRFDLKF